MASTQLLALVPMINYHMYQPINWELPAISLLCMTIILKMAEDHH